MLYKIWYTVYESSIEQKKFILIEAINIMDAMTKFRETHGKLDIIGWDKITTKKKKEGN
jgi:hypothetical protein